MEHDNNIITVVYVYAPNSEFYELTSLKIVMYKMKMIKKKKSGKIVREMIQRFDLYDMWSELKPSKKGLTWCDGNHLLIVFKFRISCNTRWKRFWKLNVSVLHDANYIKTMNDFLNNSRILQNVLETLKYIFLQISYIFFRRR